MGARGFPRTPGWDVSGFVRGNGWQGSGVGGQGQPDSGCAGKRLMGGTGSGNWDRGLCGETIWGLGAWAEFGFPAPWLGRLGGLFSDCGFWKHFGFARGGRLGATCFARVRLVWGVTGREAEPLVQCVPRRSRGTRVVGPMCD